MLTVTKNNCYYNGNKKDTNLNSFRAVTRQTLLAGKILCSVVNIIDKTNSNINIYSKINDELGYFINDSIQSKWSIQGASGTDIDRAENTERNSRSYKGVSKNQDFFQDNKSIMAKKSIQQQELNL